MKGPALTAVWDRSCSASAVARLVSASRCGGKSLASMLSSIVGGRRVYVASAQGPEQHERPVAQPRDDAEERATLAVCVLAHGGIVRSVEEE